MALKPKYDKILSKKFLIQEYIKNKKNTNEIARMIGCSGHTVCLYLKNNDINNLVSLCIHCHRKTNFKRNLWKKELKKVINND